MVHNILQLLERAASTAPDNGLAFYLPGKLGQVGRHMSYHDILQIAKGNAQGIRNLSGARSGSIVLLHFNNHVDNVEWLWAVIAAGLLPAISTPMTNDAEGRKRHLSHLREVLEDPIVLTTESLRGDFESVKTLNIQTIEHVRSSIEDYGSSSDEDSPTSSSSSTASSDRESRFSFEESSVAHVRYGHEKSPDEAAILMLTSGSSGNAKAVVLRHGQILKAVKGKSVFHGTSQADTFLNWIGLDHVANLTECHLQAMSLAANQVHVQASDLLSQPEAFFDIVDRHRINYSFAPNFFLASLKRAVESSEGQVLKKWDLSCLRACISGGEANVLETTRAFSELVRGFNAPDNCVRPGFGMTETCAGCIYNNQCPQVDLEAKREFASLGTSIPGLNMRIQLEDGSSAGVDCAGSLQLSGSMLFKEYYNNSVATKEAFTEDGWFITGDLALIDGNGHLVLAGRSKETIIVNGVKYFPHELEAAIEEANITGVVPSYTAVFPHRPKNSDTESLVVTYLPSYDKDDSKARVTASDQIARVSVMQSGARPYAIIPLERSLLPKSTLGKLSRAKLRTAFESGAYASYQHEDEMNIKAYRATQIELPSDDTESEVLDCFVDFFKVPREEMSLSISLFDWGVSSIEIIKLKTILQQKLNLQQEIPVITMMSNPTIKGLAAAIRDLKKPHKYNPIVTLQSGGSKTPIFLVHPGVGEVLVFLNLAKYITDRPVHAIRARGFDGEDYFRDIPEVVNTYYDAIKKTQPEGPYALAGYSYGSMLAFETAKKLEANGDKVGFLGSFNLPPHIKFRMRQLDWIEVLLNLSYFLDLITDEYAHQISPEMHKLSNPEVLDFILSKAPPARMTEMALDKTKLQRWADLAYVMQAIAQDYDPSGSVATMDVFYAIPLSAVAKNKGDWLENHLSKWQGFVRSDVRFTEVDGAHYTMVNCNLRRS